MNSVTVNIHRWAQNDKQSSGTCVILDNQHIPLFTTVSLERGWQGNKSNISCIPGNFSYILVYEYSDKFNKHLWEIKGVYSRSECKFHVANYWRNLNGCIALGEFFTDIDKDGFKDVTSSGDTMDKFHQILKPYQSHPIILNITTAPNIF